MTSIEEMKSYIQKNLLECCQEILDWHTTCVLIDGKVRHAASIIGDMPSGQRLAIVENEVKTQAMEMVVSQ